MKTKKENTKKVLKFLTESFYNKKEGFIEHEGFIFGFNDTITIGVYDNSVTLQAYEANNKYELTFEINDFSEDSDEYGDLYDGVKEALKFYEEQEERLKDDNEEMTDYEFHRWANPSLR